MAEKVEKRGLGDRIIDASGVVLAVISLISFLYLFPDTVAKAAEIGQLGPTITGISGVFFTANGIYIFLALTLIAVLAGTVSFFYRNDRISMGFDTKTNSIFFRYFAVYILVQLILSEFIQYFVPSFGQGFPFNESAGVQNFVFSFLSLEQTVIYQLIPIAVIAVVVSGFRNRFSVRSFFFYNFSTAEVLIISIFVSLGTTLITGGTGYEYISDYFTFFVLNIIFLRFGFLKAFMTSFVVSMTNVTATLFNGSVVPTQLLLGYLFFLGFLGIYSLVQMGMRAPRELPVQEKVVDPKPRKIQTMEPFIKSRCPDCGNTLFHIVSSGMLLRCTKCGRELDKDATGPENIKIELGKVPRYQTRD